LFYLVIYCRNFIDTKVVDEVITSRWATLRLSSKSRVLFSRLLLPLISVQLSYDLIFHELRLSFQIWKRSRICAAINDFPWFFH